MLLFSTAPLPRWASEAHIHSLAQHLRSAFEVSARAWPVFLLRTRVEQADAHNGRHHRHCFERSRGLLPGTEERGLLLLLHGPSRRSQWTPAVAEEPSGLLRWQEGRCEGVASARGFWSFFCCVRRRQPWRGVGSRRRQTEHRRNRAQPRGQQPRRRVGALRNVHLDLGPVLHLRFEASRRR